MKKLVSFCIVFFLAAGILFFPPSIQTVKAADDFDAIRMKHFNYLTGGSSYDPNDPNTASKIATLTQTAQGRWDTMEKSPTRTYLWDYMPDNQYSYYINESYKSLEFMATAYNTVGSSLYHNASLKTDIVNALQWMNQNRYSTTAPKAPSPNWWDYQIGGAIKLMNCTILMYDHLTTAQVNNYVDAVLRYTPSIGGYSGVFTGANRLSFAEEFVKAGAVSKRSALVTSGRDAMDPLYLEVTSGEGVYPDGSFIQHEHHAYNGGYGSGYAYGLLKIVDSLVGTGYQVVNPNVGNIYNWIYTVYEPVMYEGGFMSMVRGRFISYSPQNDFTYGMDGVRAVVFASQSAPDSGDRVYFKRLLKRWITNNTFQPILPNMPLYELQIAKQIMNDPAVPAADPFVAHKRYPNMDRVVHGRPDYTFGLSMFSSRIYNYESFSKENLHGWFTNYGATYLYNGDQGQYNGNYWATIDPYRIPGTTVDKSVRPDIDPGDATGKKGYKSGILGGRSWVGGADIAGLYGVTGMQLHDVPKTLDAKKSYFMFDDEIVLLGAGINSTDNSPIETIVENRALNSSGANVFTVNGSLKIPSLGQSATLTGTNWAHLAGNTAKSDIGYYFPGGSTVNVKRETRTGTWFDINKNGVIDEARTATQTRNYLTMWFNHGNNPVDQGYSYVLLPNKTTSQVAAYAANPNIKIIENSPDAQAVQETTLGLTAVNFWNDSTKTAGDITSTRKASVITKETDADYEIAVSDPTQVGGSPIVLEINRKGASVISKDSNVTVLQLEPTIKLSINTVNMKGATFRAKFKLSAKTFTSNKDAYVNDGANAAANYGADVNLMVKKDIAVDTGFNRKAYVHFDFSGFDYSEPEAKLKLYVSNIGTDSARTIKLYGVSNETWSETGINWNNAPAGTTYITSQSISNTDKGKWISFDVSSYVKSNLTDKNVSFLLVNEGTASTQNTVLFASRERAGFEPKLEIQSGKSFLPGADANITDGTYANTNYGTIDNLPVKKDTSSNSGYNRKSYVKFDFSSYGYSTHSKAELRLYVSSIGTDAARTIKLYGVSDTTWSETGITWNNAPAGTAYITGKSINATDNGKWISYDVTDYVRSHLNDKKVSFLLVNEGTGSSQSSISFASKEKAGFEPKLVIQYP